MTRSRNQKNRERNREKPKDTSRNAAPNEALVPRWVKSAGALTGIIVAVLGAFVGLYQVAINVKQIETNIQQQQLQAEQARAKEAEETRKKAEVEKQRSEAEAASTERLRATDLQKEQVARDAILLGIRKEVETKTLEEDFKVKQEERTLIRDENMKLNDALLGVFKELQAAPSLAMLAKYSAPGDQRLPAILTSLVAKLDGVHDASEVNIIFQLFERAGLRALDSVIDANRNALERYKADSRQLALLQFNLERKAALNRPNPGELIILDPIFERSTSALLSTQDSYTALTELRRAQIEDVWDQITRSLTGEPYRRFEVAGRTLPQVSLESLSRLELPVSSETFTYLNNDLALQLAILRQSKRSLTRLLRQTQEFVDIGGTDLSGVRLLPGSYGGINFSASFVGGADFSAAELDSDTLKSLREAYVSPNKLVKSDPRNLRLSARQINAMNSGG
jgi:hypothetical protein